MKNFLNYLSDAQKTYEFKIKVANTDPTGSVALLKTALAAYAVENITTPKSLPIMENSLDFPAIKNCEVYVMEVTLKYPVMADQLRELVARTLGAPHSYVVAIPAGHPEELWRNNEGELREYVQGENVLTQPLPNASEDQKAASKFYSEAGSILKELKPVKYDIAGSDNTIGGDAQSSYGKTTNDIPVNTASLKQNKIPNPDKGLK